MDSELSPLSNSLCITHWENYRSQTLPTDSTDEPFYVDNLRGNLDATLAAANSATGAVYPPGSVLQLIPGEAMVKRDKGFDATTHDWEFFELDVSKDGTRVRKRGAADVVNRFGGNCFQCHIQAAPQWDPKPITVALQFRLRPR
jgi:hypothetical protein